MRGIRVSEVWQLITRCRWLYGCALLVVCVTSTGCSGSVHGYTKHNEELHPVCGMVLVNGKPAKNASVVFYREGRVSSTDPSDRDAKIEPNPHGECDETGAFQIYTYTAFDGAPVGKYLVAVSWRDPEGRNRDSETYPELLPVRYVRPETSGLVATVEAGGTVLPPFQLKR